MAFKSLSGMPDGVDKEVWYHGMLPREDINHLLTKEGHFLVRQTEPKSGQGMKTVLSVLWQGKPLHFIINEYKGKLMIEKHTFPTLGDLVRFYHTRKIPVTEKSGALLMLPVPKQDWELKHEQVELGKLLGEGAFGGVYAGVMTLGDDKKVKVAVKVHKGKEMNKNIIKEICKEARIMRRYEHANIVKFYGVCIEQEPIMLIMELVDGGALDSFLQKKGSEISLVEKMEMCYDACRGLEYLHEKGCIHRDVAARNCLVSNQRVKISDFGLSKEVTTREARFKLHDTKQRLPIRWVAPEVLKDATYSSKSDVYSFGVLMWEIYENGAIPYTGMTIAEVNQYVKSGKRLPDPDMMPAFIRVIMRKKCFPESPDERGTMGEIRHAFDKVINRRSGHNSVYQKSMYQNEPPAPPSDPSPSAAVTQTGLTIDT